jgi:hypothetical protein
VGFDSESGLLIVDLNDSRGGLKGVGAIFLNVETAITLARQLKTYVAYLADLPAPERTILLLKRGAHLPQQWETPDA